MMAITHSLSSTHEGLIWVFPLSLKTSGLIVTLLGGLAVWRAPLLMLTLRASTSRI